MNRLDQFYEVIKSEMTMLLATAADDSVTIRAVSPVYCNGSILIFTAKDSRKYGQLKANPHCCVAAGAFYAEASAQFCGETMLAENKELRDVYSAKFPGAFDEGVEFGGRNAEFLLLKPTRISGWAFDDDNPTLDSIPTIPFCVEPD